LLRSVTAGLSSKPKGTLNDWMSAIPRSSRSATTGATRALIVGASFLFLICCGDSANSSIQEPKQQFPAFARDLSRQNKTEPARTSNLLSDDHSKADKIGKHRVQAAVAEVLACYGNIDVLFNNAGIIQVGPVENMQQQDFERAMGVHFWAPLLLIMEILPAMRARRSGRIINICSIGGKVAVPHLAPYCASKFALTGLSDALRGELARDNISVTTVAPGLIRTGSHVNAKFKGQHDAEFAWFSASSGMPLISMSGERAGRKILAAARCGQPSLTLTFAARGAIVANALFPNLTGQAMKIGNRFLPGPGSQAAANGLCAGRETRRIMPEWMTDLADRASAKNNELK